MSNSPSKSNRERLYELPADIQHTYELSIATKMSSCLERHHLRVELTVVSFFVGL